MITRTFKKSFIALRQLQLQHDDVLVKTLGSSYTYVYSRLKKWSIMGTMISFLSSSYIGTLSQKYRLKTTRTCFCILYARSHVWEKKKEKKRKKKTNVTRESVFVVLKRSIVDSNWFHIRCTYFTQVSEIQIISSRILCPYVNVNVTFETTSLVRKLRESLTFVFTRILFCRVYYLSRCSIRVGE